MFFGRNDAKAETSVLWPPRAKSWLIGKDSDAGRDWGQEEKGTTEDEMAMASWTWWTWIWVTSGRWWWTGRPGVLRFMGSQRVGHDWVTELNLNWECKERVGELKGEKLGILVGVKRWKVLFVLWGRSPKRYPKDHKDESWFESGEWPYETVI